MLEKLKKLKINIGWKSLIFMGVCAVLILVDILTKVYAEKDVWNFDVISGFIEVRKVSYNPGCAFSFLADADWGQPFLIAMTFILLILLVVAFIFLPERFILLKLSLSMITAGAIGNLVDRIAFHKVRDFVCINMFGSMVSCNFADFWIVIGTIIAIVDFLFINEWSVIPLTKSAKEAQRKNKEKKEEATAAISENTDAPEISETVENTDNAENVTTSDNPESEQGEDKQNNG